MKGLMRNRTKTISSLFLLLSFTSMFVVTLTNGERVYDEIIFSEQLCVELGYDKDFDVCGIIEFCKGKDEMEDYKKQRGRRNTRHRQSKKSVNRRRRNKRKIQYSYTTNKTYKTNNLGYNGNDKIGTKDEEEFQKQAEEEENKYDDTNPDPEEDEEYYDGSDADYQESHDGSEYDEEETNPDYVNDGTEEESWMDGQESNEDEYQMEQQEGGDENEYYSEYGQQGGEYYDETGETDFDNYDEYGNYDEFGGYDEYDEYDEYGDYDEYMGSSAASNRQRKEGTAVYGWRASGSDKCTWPGPIIRLTRGVKHGLFAKGIDGEITNLHLHGLHIPGHGNGDDISRRLEGADTTIIYNVTIPTYHMGGTYWYHSHYHSNANKHITGGAFGMVIVDDGNDVGTTDEGVLKFLKNEKILVVDNKEGSHQNWIGNGMVGRGRPDEFSFRPNEWYRLRIMMVNLNIHRSGGMVKFPDGCTVRSIAHDGILRFQVPSSEEKEEYGISGSGRLDVAIKCNNLQGESGYVLVEGSNVASITTISSSSNNDSFDSVQPSPYENGDRQWSSKRPEYLQDLRDAVVGHHWKIRIETTTINGQQWLPTDDNDPLCDEMKNDFHYGSIQEWEVRGTAGHPLHIHMYPVQVISDGCGNEYHEKGEYYDTVVAAGDMPYSQKCFVRTKLIDIAGKTVLHCHILKHEDMGAMGFFNVVGGPTQQDEPRVHSCGGSIQEGQQQQCDVPIKASHCHG